MLRQDSRTGSQMRPLACEQSPLSRADGSARFDMGQSSVLAAVYGPTEVSQRKDLADRAVVEVSFKPKSGIAGVAEKTVERKIKEALDACILSHLHPHSSINIIIQVLQDDGSLISCAINAAFLALMDAGIPMKACVAAASVAYLPELGMVLDPTGAEEKNAVAVMNFASLSEQTGDATSFVLSDSTGVFVFDEVWNASDAAFECCKHLFAFFRKSIERRLVRENRFVAPPPRPLDS